MRAGRAFTRGRIFRLDENGPGTLRRQGVFRHELPNARRADTMSGRERFIVSEFESNGREIVFGFRSQASASRTAAERVKTGAGGPESLATPPHTLFQHDPARKTGPGP